MRPVHFRNAFREERIPTAIDRLTEKPGSFETYGSGHGPSGSSDGNQYMRKRIAHGQRLHLKKHMQNDIYILMFFWWILSSDPIFSRCY